MAIDSIPIFHIVYDVSKNCKKSWLFDKRRTTRSQERGGSRSSDNKFRRGVPTFVVAGVAVVPRNVGDSPPPVRALTARVRPMATLLPSPRVAALGDRRLMGSEIEQRLLLVIGGQLVLCAASVCRGRWLPGKRRLQHPLLPFQQPLHRLLAL